MSVPLAPAPAPAAARRVRRRQWPRALGVAFLVAASLVALPTGAHAAKPPRPAAYTALGDSIAVGVGASWWYGYVPRFRDFLAAATGGAPLTNRAVPGYDSADLAQQLAADGATRQAVKGATVVTISIGGNNLLDCASANYAVIDAACGANGVAAFRRDWPQILTQIRSGIRSRAALYVLTLYNPYREDEPNFWVADPYVNQINAIIESAATRAAYDYEVAGAYAAFRGQTAPGGPWRVCQLTHFCEDKRDPHPTDAGHA